YRGTGGPKGKDWSSCPGFQNCTPMNEIPEPVGCFSFTNDASILLPSTAMTGNYRVPALYDSASTPFIAVTGTQDGTSVTVRFSSTSIALPGGPIQSKGNAPVTFQLDAGDVVEVAADDAGDIGGTLVQADKPVQVLAGVSCGVVPSVDGATC